MPPDFLPFFLPQALWGSIVFRSIYSGIILFLQLSHSDQVSNRISMSFLSFICVFILHPCDILYRKSNIVKVSDIVNVQNLLLVFDCMKGQLPTALLNIFIPVKNTHNYGTRSWGKELQNTCPISKYNNVWLTQHKISVNSSLELHGYSI